MLHRSRLLNMAGVIVGLVALLSAAHAATYKDLVLADAPTYYWTFDEASGNALNYGSGSGGVLVTNTTGTRVASTFTHAGLFLGTAESGGFISTVSGGTNLTQGTNFSVWAIEFWIKPASAGQIYLMDAGNNGDHDAPSMFWDWPGVCSNAIDIYTSGHKLGPTLTIGNWYHIVIGYDGTGTTTFYTNGVVAATVTGASGVFSAINASFGIGSMHDGEWGGNSALIDEFAIYDLSTIGAGYNAKLKSLAAHSANPPYMNLVLADNPTYYWTFDEEFGNAFNYGSGSGGTLVPTVSNPPRVGSTTNAKGLALGLAVINSFRNNLTGGALLTYGTNFTKYAIEFWINPTATGNRYLLDAGIGGDNPSMFWDWPGVCPGGTDIYSGGSHKLGPSLAVGNWNHIVVGSDNASNTTFYKNGTIAAMVSSSGGPFSASNAPFAVGCATDGSAGGSNVIMDELAIYDLSALNTAEYAAKLASIAAHSLPFTKGAVIKFF